MPTMMHLEALAKATLGSLYGENSGFDRVVTDSRQVMPHDLFIALEGDRFDGHSFIPEVVAAGASAVVIARDRLAEFKECGIPLLLVADTRRALGQLAGAWRQRLSLPIVGVTGSNGKTSTKEMVSAILRVAYGDHVCATQGNLNNDIGLPLSILRINESHAAAVLELGMNHPGEIAELAHILSPTVAIVTNAQRAHLQGMGSLECIAHEKGSIFKSLREGGGAVFSAEEAWAPLWRTMAAGHRILDFSFSGPAAIHGEMNTQGEKTQLTIRFEGKTVQCALSVLGAHNARNALAAAAAALSLGISLEAISEGLSGFHGVRGRLQEMRAVNGARLLDDTYNANPDSVRAAIDVLSVMNGKKILVLGDMGEIGEMSAKLHDEVGAYAKARGVDHLFSLGTSSALAARHFGTAGAHFSKIEDLIDAVLKELSSETTVLIKGSRFMQMERVLRPLMSGTEGSTGGSQ